VPDREGLAVTTDAQGRERRGVYLPRECWDWLHERAGRDDSSVSDLLEGLVLLAQDRDTHVERSPAITVTVHHEQPERVVFVPVHDPRLPPMRR
jgi:hypothetical protein